MSRKRREFVKYLAGALSLCLAGTVPQGAYAAEPAVIQMLSADTDAVGEMTATITADATKTITAGTDATGETTAAITPVTGETTAAIAPAAGETTAAITPAAGKTIAAITPDATETITADTDATEGKVLIESGLQQMKVLPAALAEEEGIYPNAKSSPTLYTPGTTAEGVLIPNEPTVQEEGETYYYNMAFYTIAVNSTGRYNFSYTGDGMQFQVVEDPDFESYGTTSMRWRSWRNPAYLDLIGGTTYYLTADANSCSGEYAEYSFSLTLDERYLVNTPVEPATVVFDKTYASILCDSFRDQQNGDYPPISEADYRTCYYSFQVLASGRVTFQTVSSKRGISWRLWDSTEGPSQYSGWNLSIPQSEITYNGEHTDTVDMIAGTYLLAVGLGAYGDETAEASYSFSASFDPIDVGANEKAVFDTTMEGSNSSSETAVPVQVDQKYVAQSIFNSYQRNVDEDWFTFTLSKPSKLYLSASTTQIDGLSFQLYSLPQGLSNPSLVSTDPFPYAAGYNNPLTAAPVVTSKDSLSGKKISTMDAGTYYIRVEKTENLGVPGSVGKTGAYRFEIRTEAEQAVKSITILDKTTGKAVPSVKLAVNETKALEAQVLPVNAVDTSVQWSSDKEDVAKVDSTGLITALKEGTCTVTATTNGLNDAGKVLTASCTVEVTKEGSGSHDPEDPQEQYPDVVIRQKINLYDAAYFNRTPDKADKWIVEPKACGSVSAKGVFTAKKAGEVKVTRGIKEGKSITPLDSVTFTVYSPYNKENNKDVKKKTVYKREEIIFPTEFFDYESVGLTPVKFECSDKRQKNFAFDAKTGQVQVFNNGSCTVSIYYGDLNTKGFAAKHVYTIKASLPKLPKAVRVRAGKSKVVSLTNLRKDLPDDPEWSVMWIDPATGEETYDWDIVDLDPAADGRKCSVEAREGTKGKVAVLVATVEGVEYYSAIYIN